MTLGRHEDAARLVGAAEALRRDERPDSFETPVLEQHAPGLEAALGGHHLDELEAEGFALGRATLVSEVVSASTEE